MKNKAFSFIELIISIAIIILLAFIGLSYKNSYDENKFDTKVLADLKTLNNSILSYKQEKSELPKPGGNLNYYKSDSSYSHDENGAFGVHGYVTNDFIPKKYLDSLPLDPRTNQFYAYGKTLDNKSFEIAGVITEDGEYKTKIQGNYSGGNLVGLIREYNGPQFLYDNSFENFPYNPEQRLMTAKIGSYSGVVEINGDRNNILQKTIVTGDIITTKSNSSAEIFFSDGSKSILEENSSLKIEKMDFPEDNNLITQVKLFLSEGTIWTKATRLNPDGSQFDISTTDATAAVRGTIFGVKKDNSGTNIKLIVGKLDILDKNGNLLENLEVTPGESPIIVNYKNETKQPGYIDFSNSNEVIYPSNLRLQIKSIKNITGGQKEIEIPNYFSNGELHINNQAVNCNFQVGKIKCNIPNFSSNAYIKFCKKTSPLGELSCTRPTKISNLTYISPSSNIENLENLNSENQNYLSSQQAPNNQPQSNQNQGGNNTPGGNNGGNNNAQNNNQGNNNQAPNNQNNSQPSQTEKYCNGTFTPGCIKIINGKKIRLIQYKSGKGCGACGGGIKSNTFFGHGIPFRGKKYCKQVITINGNRPKCAKKSLFSRKSKSWTGYKYEIMNN